MKREGAYDTKADAAELQRSIFKTGSKTYFNSSLFFPRDVREDVFALYSFVRIADNYVDDVPQDPGGFYSFRDKYKKALDGGVTNDPVIAPFVDLVKKHDFDTEWVDAFLYSMELDLKKSCYDTLEQTLEYIYGSAEVIGLFMCKILDLPSEAHDAARMQGRAMQYINFIRDIDEDNFLGRRYLPLSGSKLESLNADEARKKPDEFVSFIKQQIELYNGWQSEAEKGYIYIPKRYRIAVKTASDMYNWTAGKILDDPLIVFKSKIKPPKPRILMQAVWNAITC